MELEISMIEMILTIAIFCDMQSDNGHIVALQSNQYELKIKFCNFKLLKDISFFISTISEMLKSF